MPMQMQTHSPTSRIMFLLISILLLFISFLTSSADENLIHSVCSDTPSPDACESIFFSDPRGLLAHTRKDLLLVAVEAIITAATAANRDTGYMAGQYMGTPQQEPLTQCEQLYMMVAVDMQSVRAMIWAASYEEAYQAATDVWKIPDACDNEFATRRLPSLLARKNRDLDRKIELCVNLTYFMINTN